MHLLHHKITEPAVRLASEEENARAIRALKISLLVLIATGLVQLVIAVTSKSVALLADTIHNLGDALTAIPLGLAFYLSRRPPTRRFTYGLSRSQDLAGIVVVIIILFSAAIAAYQAVDRLLNPRDLEQLPLVALAGIIGFIGNEAVAIFRIRVGTEIGSAALIADGKHARIDGLTSLAVVVGAAGVALGFRLADPIIGILITVAILRIVVHTARDVGMRALDAVEPEIVDQIEAVALATVGVLKVGEVRARWVGHDLHAEVNVAVDSTVSVAEGHQVAKLVHSELLAGVPHLGAVIVHIDPIEEASERFHDS